MADTAQADTAQAKLAQAVVAGIQAVAETGHVVVLHRLQELMLYWLRVLGSKTYLQVLLKFNIGITFTYM